MSIKSEINEYLFYEFGFDIQNEDAFRITDDWPFKLQATQASDIFIFSDGQDTYFANRNGGLNYYQSAGMSVADIQLQIQGSAWIIEREPVRLDESRIGYDAIPSAYLRRNTIEKLAMEEVNSGETIRILEGLFLAKTGQYLSLVENTTTGATFVVGSNIRAKPVDFSTASPWRRLAFSIGKLLQLGELH